MTTPPPESHPTCLPLEQALKAYWKNLIGLAVFPPVAFIGIGGFELPSALFMPCFFAAGLPALWPYLTKRTPYSFWIVAMGVWMASSMISVMLMVILAVMGVTPRQ